MSPFLKYSLLLLVVLALLAPVGIYLLSPSPAPAPATTPAETQTAPPAPPALSVLGKTPDWSSLQAYQDTITREEFVRLLTTVFTTGEAWRDFIEIDETEARIGTGAETDAGVVHLKFARPGTSTRIRCSWKNAADLPPAPPDKPLDGLHIAIDPGHIGGRWAKVEERRFVVGDGTPVCEGDMTLLVAKLLKPRLEALGARVSLVREKPEPLTSLRPESLMDLARESAEPGATPADIAKLAERLFYRTAEIHARADLVNQTIRPDLVLCLHFNADPWGDPNHPTLVDRTHFHLLLNGAYTDDEVALADQRHSLLEKLLSGTHAEETQVGATVADTFMELSGLPTYTYPAGSPNALPVDGHPNLWARNLLANRLYDCPVLFIEPYVMNSTIDYPRIQAGDYDGLREVAGKPQPSIFREYADSLAHGLARHYLQHRKSPEGQ